MKKMELSSAVAFIASLGVTFLFVVQCGLIIGAETMRDGGCLTRAFGDLAVYGILFPVMVIGGIGVLANGPDSPLFRRWEEPDLRVHFSGLHCVIAGLVAIATTIAWLTMVSSDLQQFGVPQMPWWWLVVRCVVAYKAQVVLQYRALDDEGRRRWDSLPASIF